MESTLTIVIILLFVLILLLAIVLGVFLIKYLKLKDTNTSLLVAKSEKREFPLEAQELNEEANSQSSNLLGSSCVDHPDLPAKGMCSISDEIYCELCIAKEKDIKVARKYLNVLLDSQWDTLFILPCEVVGADKINELMRLKKILWSEQEIPVITQKQFKINIENDRIEDYTAVMAREQDCALVKKTFEFLEANHDTADL